MTYETLEVNISNGIAKVVVNRPKVLNALNTDVLKDLTRAFRDLKKEDGLRGVYITGSGDKAFVAGADIASMKEMTSLQAQEFVTIGHKAMRTIETFPQPVIAAVNGFALGGGLELALSCDFIYAATNAKLGLPEVNLGIFPGFGGTQRLARVIGRNRAKEMIFSANMISAEEALNMGLVNKVVAPEELIATVEKTLQTIASKGPIAISLAKRVVDEGADLALASGLAFEETSFPLVFSTEDMREGVTAFLEKRKAVFKGL